MKMAMSGGGSPQRPRKQKKRREGYIHKSPAICVVVHDPHGKPISNDTKTEILNTVTNIALREGYLINFTQT